MWQQAAGPTIFAPFPADSEKFGRRDRQWMPNFRVRDLDAMLAQLRRAGVKVEDRAPVTEAGVGRFAWLSDPEGDPHQALGARRRGVPAHLTASEAGQRGR